MTKKQEKEMIDLMRSISLKLGLLVKYAEEDRGE